MDEGGEGDQGRIRQTALGLLARREHSRSELQLKLQARFPDATDRLASELDRLEQEGLQSDARFCESLVRSRIGRGQGPDRIRQELRRKGIHESSIEQFIDAADVDWLQVITHVKNRRFGSQQAQDPRQKGKMSRFLRQRGFTFEQINEVI